MRGVIAGFDAKFTQRNNLEGRYLAKSILLGLVNMETGQRGFLLTGLDESLEPFIVGGRTFNNELSKMKALVNKGRGSGVTIDELEGLQNLLEDWIAKQWIVSLIDFNGCICQQKNVVTYHFINRITADCSLLGHIIAKACYF